jgi:hypothetical protein
MFHIQVAGDESWWANVQVPDTLARLTSGMYANVTRSVQRSGRGRPHGLG